MVILGIMLGPGRAPTSTAASPRFTFGSLELLDGISLVAMAMGLFGVAEVIATLRDGCIGDVEQVRRHLRSMIPTRDDCGAPGCRSCAAPPSDRSSAPCRAPAASSPPSSPTRSRSKRRRRPLALRQGRDRRAGRAGDGEQRRRPDRLHPDHDARHSRQRDDGDHAGRADHARHHAGPIRHRRSSRSSSGA